MKPAPQKDRTTNWKTYNAVLKSGQIPPEERLVSVKVSGDGAYDKGCLKPLLYVRPMPLSPFGKC